MTSSDFDHQLDRLAALYLAGEEDCLKSLFKDAELPSDKKYAALERARRWIEDVRRNHRPTAGATDLLARFGLTSQEGLALMCLAEALLRIPDTATADALIRDKLNETHWNEALGTGAPWTMNAAGWALSLTGKIIQLGDPNALSVGATLGSLISRLGQPVIREAIRHAMKWLADQFVLGETIDGALKRAERDMAKGVRFSFDMLGEGARSAMDASRYLNDYLAAVTRVGEHQKIHRFRRPSGISVKLSALHPRYEMINWPRVQAEMLPLLIQLCERAAHYNIPLTIDAEEADRLQLSLQVAKALFDHKELNRWDGLGFAVQAYQKRAPVAIDTLVGLATNAHQRIHIRLVKGAYWDTEIKRSQERGLSDFPVFTRKAATDVSYLACAKRMLDAGDSIYPVFGTHNAMTVAHIVELAKDPDKLEFQRLHGMGEDLHELMHQDKLACCVYAPVGNHEVLLGYLVRRILENGANSSFVHRLLDPTVPISDLTRDPVDEVLSYPTLRHPLIVRPVDLYRPERRNSIGYELSDPYVSGPLMDRMRASPFKKAPPVSFIGGREVSLSAVNARVTECFISARAGIHTWSHTPVDARATCLETLAKLLEKNAAGLMDLLVVEGKKTVPDALSEIREAVDFCRYYAVRARHEFKVVVLPGPTGEQNTLRLHGRGIFVCISPWNFPLAIFLGQITAALVSGNVVIAKPAPQTPKIASSVARLIYDAGIPKDAFHLLLGDLAMGEALVKHADVAGVAFTGSNKAARSINQVLAAKEGPIVPLIAETGGQNAMIVDSSALIEQVVDDVITSAFRSAGQRCSALRVLCLPHATADKILQMLRGAMAELKVGDPSLLETDVGPVIDVDAQERLLKHVERLKIEAKEIFTVPVAHIGGCFVYPQAWEIPSMSWVTGEVFGPILHIVRYDPHRLMDLIKSINAFGFGLTGGLHSRIAGTVDLVENELNVGNFYVNRTLIGAVVGVQPFGGQGLSGTGPKAGGPHYLSRFSTERVTSYNVTAAGGNASLLATAAQNN